MASLPVDTVREIESLVTDWMDDNDVPGVSVVVVDPDGERYADGFGARDVESNDPATPDTLYGMGSITKSFTSLAVVQLAESGDLSLEDPVDEYVDHLAAAPGDPITVAELLSHTSGMPATQTGGFLQNLEGFPSGVADEDDFKRHLRESTAYRATDGERFMYYNGGYAVLGRVVEAVDGRPYEEYVDEEIIQPLGMERATFDPEALEEDDDAATGYRPGDDEEPPEPTEFPLPELDRPAGGLIASVRELSRFLRATMTDGSLEGTTLCSPESVDRLQEGRATPSTYLDGREYQYGYGWTRRPLGDEEVVGHGGSILTSTSYSGFLTGSDLGVVVATNTVADPGPGGLGQAILALVDGRDVTDVPVYALKRKAEAVSGTYEAFREQFAIAVEPAGGGLSVTIEHPAGDEEFRASADSLDPDDHEYYVVSGGGMRDVLEFDLEGEHDDLYFQRHRVRRKQPGS
jgi:CubicO group peptidase (beta-lactamase class C family)